MCCCGCPHFEHLYDVGLNYWEHWKHAMFIALRLCYAQQCIVIHAFWPDWYPTTATDIMRDVLKEHEALIDHDSFDSTVEMGGSDFEACSLSPSDASSPESESESESESEKSLASVTGAL